MAPLHGLSIGLGLYYRKSRFIWALWTQNIFDNINRMITITDDSFAHTQIILLWGSSDFILSLLGPRHNIYFCTQYCDKKIFGQKDNFESQISTGQGKLLTKHNPRYGTFLWELNLVGIDAFDSKLSFYRNIFLSQCRNIVCENV